MSFSRTLQLLRKSDDSKQAVNGRMFDVRTDRRLSQLTTPCDVAADGVAYATGMLALSRMLYEVGVNNEGLLHKVVSNGLRSASAEGSKDEKMTPNYLGGRPY